jgi:uncharacterized phage protein (TIGR02218 family)
MSTSVQQQQNLKVPYNYIQWILQTNRGIMAHLYQFTSVTGAQDYFTDFDTDIIYGGQTWKSNSLRFEGMSRKLSVGINVDAQTIKIWASPTDTLWGSAFLAGAEQGLMDGAVVVRSRAIWPFVTGNAAADVQNTPLAVWPLSTGYVSTIDKGGASHVEVKITSALSRLNVNMPRNYWQPGCGWTLFDAGCTLIKADFAITGTISAVLDNSTLSIAGGLEATGPDGNPNLAQGRLLFTSGVNNNFQTLIDTNDDTNIYLAYPLSDLPSVGDNVTFYPGCSKTYNTCSNKWGNQANFRGFDKVPPVMVSV